jgi:hypothetical protein
MKQGMSSAPVVAPEVDHITNKPFADNAISSQEENGFKTRTSYKALHTLTVIIIILSFINSGIGLFDTSGGAPTQFTNQYGDSVTIYGSGLYKHDSLFRAPIFRGTDFTMLFIACPLLILALFLHIKKPTLKAHVFLTSVISCFTYYAASISFGVTYNYLQLVYILLFSASFFGLITGMMQINYTLLEKRVKNILPYRGISIFLVFTGVALYAAWLPDIINALVAKRPLLLIENYTTEITYVMDMGIMAPAIFTCLFLLKRRKGMGFVLLDMMLTICVLIGIMLPIQTVFQMQAGIQLPMAAIITKMGSFCLLALFALYFKIQSVKNIRDDIA